MPRPARAGEFVIAPELTAQGDAGLMRIVLENLLSNAWKFTSKREQAHIELDTVHGAEGGTVFRVKDNGAGFDPRYASKLFGPFQRCHSQADFPGTGIGLATVQRIVHRHGGKIWVEAQLDRGASFFFHASAERRSARLEPSGSPGDDSPHASSPNRTAASRSRHRGCRP